VSNAIRYDSLLLRALAAELDARLRGLRVARAHLERSARVLTVVTGPRRRPLTLRWSLHPASGHLLLAEQDPAPAGALLQVAPGTSIAAVSTLPDERILRIRLDAGPVAPGLVRALVVELLGNRWNALALGADDVIVDMLVPHRSDPRGLRPGVLYSAPPARPRSGPEAVSALAEWLAALAETPAARRRSVLLEKFAYTSPLNVDWVLGDAASREAGVHELEDAHRRYQLLLDPAPRPCLLGGVQPYPFPLTPDAAEAPSLLRAFALAAEVGGTAPVSAEGALRSRVLAGLHHREQRLLVRREKLQQEAAGATGEASRLRADADLLLAHLHAVPRGAAVVELADFGGTPRRLELDPAVTPQRNARQWYEQARRRSLAAERVPSLVERLERELAKLVELRARVESGEASEAELLPWAARAEQRSQPRTLPYRTYRTTGGLEVRVGRNARANDVLTRDHASPEDIWLHARDTGGAHVILRWGRREANPAHADLVEAACLAAVHSRSRTSALVAVDWTRRKYVRRPRKAGPGQVVLERASTVFVEPDIALEQRLREGEETP
jgi:predicted ribosome quality control (RQC) complex YloA/Tae2 family protein